MKKIIITMVASLLISGSLWAEEDKEFVCEVTTKKLEKDVLKCKKGDVLNIVKTGGAIHRSFALARAQACELGVLYTQSTPISVLCTYRGSLREVR